MISEQPFVLQDRELAGFELAGVRRADGTIRMVSSNRIIPEWPEEITLLGATYTFEYKTPGSPHEEGVWENATYV